MEIFKLEHSQAAYRADFALYFVAVALLAAFVVSHAAPNLQWRGAALVMAGLASWSLIEYLLHRFVLHGVQPFRGWHEAHHARPHALICTPTLLSAALILVLVFLPAWSWGGLWQASALVLGVVAGYLAYAVIHHAMHHWRGRRGWLAGRKRWHALHHHASLQGCYGVSSGLWDRVFATTPPATPR